MTTELWAVFTVAIGTLVSGFAPIMLKKASVREFSSIRLVLANYNLFGAMSLYSFGLVIFIAALKGGELSVLYPLASLNYVWAGILSVKFLGEKMDRFKWLGIFLIIMGIFFIGLGSG